MSDLWRLTCHCESETEFDFFAASASKASVTLIQRLCLFRVCDNIVDYVRELSLHFVVKLIVTKA